MAETERGRVAQISAVLWELKKGGVELDLEQSRHLEGELANAQPGDVLNNEKFRVTVNEGGFTTELGDFLKEEEKEKQP
jgi:hypothetical protein